jgi:hypothetical protein
MRLLVPSFLFLLGLGVPASAQSWETTVLTLHNQERTGPQQSLAA